MDNYDNAHANNKTFFLIEFGEKWIPFVPAITDY